MKILTPLFLFFAFSLVNAQVPRDGSSETKADALSCESSYTGDLCNNVRGGLKRGTAYLGLANLRLGFDTELAGTWKGGYFFINGAAAHGKSPTETLLGDFQVASNIDAGDHIYLHELWFRQTVGKTEIVAGLQDMNTRFIVSDEAGYYLNSSFGVPSVVSSNVPVPIYPLTALGISLHTSLSKQWNLSLAIFDGCPTHFEANPYNTDWKLKKDDGALWMAELHYSYRLKGYAGRLKSGYYYHSKMVHQDVETGLPQKVFDYNHGIYFLVEQNIWEGIATGRNLSAFAQAALSPGKVNTHHFYGGAGITYCGIFEPSGTDALGLAIAHARFNHSVHRTETVAELFYKVDLTSRISLQPDIQYIMNPAGTTMQLENALLGTVRIGIHF